MYWTFRQKDKISCIRCIGHLDRKTRSLVLDVLDIRQKDNISCIRCIGRLDRKTRSLVLDVLDI